jgi:hypothetical protein
MSACARFWGAFPTHHPIQCRWVKTWNIAQHEAPRLVYKSLQTSRILIPMSILYRRAGQWETSSCYQLVRFFVLTAPEQVRSLVPRLLVATQLKYPGVAGYGNDSWAIGQSYADHPILQPVLYNSPAPAGSQWSRDGLSASAVPRMYHSTATLLPDSEGAVILFRLARYL